MKKVGARAGLKRPNRSRGYSTYIARHKENSRNYIVLLGLERKNFIFSMAAVQKLDSSQNCSDLDHGSGGKEREVKGNPFWCLPTVRLTMVGGIEVGRQ